MGWHPTAPEYANFPNVSKAKDYDIKLRRGSQNRHDGNKPQGRHKTRPYYVILRNLADHARSVGWLNGVKIGKK